PTRSTLFPYTTLFRSEFSEQLSIGPFSKLISNPSLAWNTILGTDPTATPHPTYGQARPDNRRDTLHPLLLVQRHHPPPRQPWTRSEEHTSELQSLAYL